MIRLKKILIKQHGILFSIYPNGIRAFDDDLLEVVGDEYIWGILSDDSNRVPLIAYDPKADVFQSIQFRDNTEYEFSIELPMRKSAFIKECERNSLFPFSNPALQEIIRFNGPDSCSEVDDGYRVTGRFNFESRAGTSYLDLALPEGIKVHLPVEILTQKLDYYDEFQQLLFQIAEYNAELLIKFDTATEANFAAAYESDTCSPMAELMAFRRCFRDGRIENYIREIINNPSMKTSPLIVKEDAAFAINPDWAQLAMSSLDYDFIPGGPLKESFSGFTPTKLPDRKIISTIDTKDNRFVKGALLLLGSRLDHLKARMPKKYKASQKMMQAWGEALDTLLLEPFWRDVGVSQECPNSMVMVNRKGYREFLILYLAFGMSIKLESEKTLLSVSGDIKPVFDLYEIWCYLMIHRLIVEIVGDDGNSDLIFSNSDGNFLMELISKSDKPVIFSYKLKGEEVELSLYYNKNFKPINDNDSRWVDSYSGGFNPDISIAIKVAEVKHWLHFDAKYRLNFSMWKSGLQGGESAAVVKREDIHKMHTYRDAVLGTRGSYVLYPGSQSSADLYIRNPSKSYRESNLMPGVGAFPLKPTTNLLQAKQMECISQHIKDCIEGLLDNGDAYKEEYGFQL